MNPTQTTRRQVLGAFGMTPRELSHWLALNGPFGEQPPLSPAMQQVVLGSFGNRPLPERAGWVGQWQESLQQFTRASIASGGMAAPTAERSFVAAGWTSTQAQTVNAAVRLLLAAFGPPASGSDASVAPANQPFHFEAIAA